MSHFRRRTVPAGVAFVSAAVIFGALMFAAGAPSAFLAIYQERWHAAPWLVTFAFSIYAVTLPGTLLVAGSLSDHVGRKPVLIGALTLQLASMATFIFASGITSLIVARALQGIASAAVTSSSSAYIVEIAPARMKRGGAVLIGVAPLGGLGLGALLAGVGMEISADPSRAIFTILFLVFLIGTIIAIASPETIGSKPGALSSLIPRLSVPRTARRDFTTLVPALVGTWMGMGLIFGLMTAMNRTVFHVANGIANGAMIAVFPFSGTIAILVLTRLGGRRMAVLGLTAAVIGLSVVALGVDLGVPAILLVGAALAGAGHGAVFAGTVRTLSFFVGAERRAELFAAIFLVCYLSFGLPTIAAGVLAGVIGLVHAVVFDALAAAGVSVVALVATSVNLRRHGEVGRPPAPRQTGAGSSAEGDPSAVLEPIAT